MPSVGRDKNTKQWMFIGDDGTQRPATREEAGEIAAQSPQNKQGVGFWERLAVKNVAASPAQARDYLRSHGYHVIPFGKGFNFSVQKVERGDDGKALAPDPNKWKVVDPRGGAGDLVFDILDWTADAAAGLATGAATTAGAFLGGGVPGAVAGAAVGGAASEFARQGVGSMIGMEDNIDPLQAGLVGAVSGALPAAGGTARVLARGAYNKAIKPFGQDIVGEVASRVVGFRGNRSMSGVQMLAKTSAMTAGGQELVSPISVARMGRQFVVQARKHGFVEEESIIASELSRISGKTLDMKRIRSSLTDLVGREKRARPQISEALEWIDDAAGGLEEGLPGLRTMSVPKAQELKLVLQDIAEDLGAYSQTGIPPSRAAQTAARKVKEAAASIRSELERLSGGERGALARANKEVSNKSTLLRWFEDKVGRGTTDPDQLLLNDKEAAEEWVVNLINAGKEGGLDKLDELDRLFGTYWRDFIPEAIKNLPVDARRSIARAMYESPTGLPKSIRGLLEVGANEAQFPGGLRALPRFTAQGRFLGPSLIGGSIGAATGLGGDDPVMGGLAGAGLGMMIGSPRFIAAATRKAMSFDRAMDRIAAPITMGHPVRSSVAAGTRQAISQSALRQILGNQDKPVSRMDTRSAKRKELDGD